MPRQLTKIIEIEEKEIIPYYGKVNGEYGEVNENKQNKTPEPEYKITSSRKFIIKKPNAFDGFILAKTLAAKLLPIFQSFVPLIGEIQRSNANGANGSTGGVGAVDTGTTNGTDGVNVNTANTVNTTNKTETPPDTILENLGNYLSLDSIALALDKLSPTDAKQIMQMSLQNVFETLPAGEAQVYKNDGTFGVMDIEYDTILTLRLVCEFIMWGLGDFFDVGRLGSIMSSLFSTLRSTQRT